MLHALLLAAHIQDADVPDLHETTRETIGVFVVEHERWVRRGPPIMHAPDAWTKVRLVWRSADGRLTVTWEDDGRTLRPGITAKAAASDDSCLVVGGVGAYGRDPGTAAGWIGYYPSIRRDLRDCKDVSAADMARYAGEYRAAAPDFPAASVRLRATATAAFGNIAHRCTAFRQPSFADPFQGRACTRWSDGSAPDR